MRKFLVSLGVIMFLFVLVIPALAAPKVILDGQPLVFEVSPTIENGRTLVPLRAIFEALGANVSWDGPTQTVTATKADITIKLQIGSQTAYRNNQAVSLEVPGKIIENRTMVPLRFVSEGLGATVKWDGQTQTISISKQASIPLSAQNLPQAKLRESDHFNIYYTEKDGSCINEVVQRLEGSYAKITEELKVSQMEKVNIIIYPNLEDFHQAINQPNAPDWLVGYAVGRQEILMVSPINPGPSHNDMYQVVVHEFAHCVTANIQPDVYQVKWLSEGVALYEAGQRQQPPNNLPSLDQLNNSDTYIYGVGYVLIEYIVDQWGLESLRTLILAKGDIPFVLHISTTEFEQGWSKYVSNKY